MARVYEGEENSVILHPAFPGHPAAIVFSANDYYCPYLSVMLLSVLEHASASRVYDIVVLNRDITPENQGRLRGMAEGMDNVSVRFLDVGSLLEGRSLYTGGREEFSVDAYSRLLIPDVLAPEYGRALYLDSDMLALADVGELLDVDLDGHLLAACRDVCGVSMYYDPKDSTREYWDEVLRLRDPEGYFNSGMLVLDLDALRAECPPEELLRLAASGEWRLYDQDVLNMVCDGGRARLIDIAWNAFKSCELVPLLPPAYRAELEEAMRGPRIVHFAGPKPWWGTASPWTELFWGVAARTPFYGETVRRLLESHEELGARLGKLEEYAPLSGMPGGEKAPAPYRAAYFLIRKFYGGVHYLQEHGPAYTARRTLEHLAGRA